MTFRQLIVAYQTASTQEQQDKIAAILSASPFWMEGSKLTDKGLV